MATQLLITLFVILEAGCNDVLGYDDCEVCNEKNTSYRRINGLFTRPNLDYGYNYVTTIPRTASNITISQLKSSNNHLALRKTDGSNILNGDWNINQPGEYQSCGTTFSYRRELDLNNLIKEYILSPGPLDVPIQLMLMALQVNSGIKYEYDIPISEVDSINRDFTNDAAFQSKTSIIQHRVDYGRNETITSSNVEEYSVSSRRHRRKHFSWKSCFKSCGNGIYRSTVCIRNSNGQLVPESHCSTLEKPIQDDNKCNTTKKCLPQWVATEWSPCSASCGEGLQKREVVCKLFTSAGNPITVHSGACFTSPLTVRKCQLQPCETFIAHAESWDVGPWSECSSSCGPGLRTRQVTCPTNRCSISDAPSSKEPCNSICRAGVGIWLTSEWSVECSESCGSGWQRRNVICYGSEDCDKTERPETYRACNSDESCTGQWFEGPWHKCNGICHYGEQRREIVCVAKIRNQFVVVPDQNCKPDRKPPSVQRCPLPECSAVWYVTNWSMCSSPCGGGFQYREVFCIKDNTESSSCPVDEKPITAQHCNTNSCTNLITDDECEDKHKYCQTAVVQARLCQYDYYKALCCQACCKKN